MSNLGTLNNIGLILTALMGLVVAMTTREWKWLDVGPAPLLRLRFEKVEGNVPRSCLEEKRFINTFKSSAAAILKS